MADLEPVLRASITRRRFLQGSALAGASAFIAACVPGSGSNTQAPTTAPATTGPSASPGATVAPTQQVATGPLKWANWTAYIDLSGAAADAGQYQPGSSPTIEQFKQKYGVEVDYEEKINDNPSFIQSIKPALVAGLPTGWDLMVITDWMASKVVTSKWVEKIDQSSVPNCVQNLRDPLRNQPWDTGNDYHYPWQSGMTGVGYNSTAYKAANLAAPTKIADMWIPPASKVTFLTEAHDTFGLGLLKLGIDANPATVTTDNLQAVHDDMKPLVAKGLRFTGNDYLQDFGQKKVWVAMVWSGDLQSSAGPDDHFVFPEEGTMIWTDNMMIPKGAVNKYTAELMMNFVYDPKIAAQIAAGVFYVSPVNGAAEVLKATHPELADSPLMFPTPDVIAKQRNFQFLSDALETKMNDLYADLAGV